MDKAMTTKDKVLQMVQGLDEDVNYDRVIYRLCVMKGIEIGLRQGNAGQVIDHDKVFATLSDDDEKHQNSMDGSSKQPSSRNKKVHRQGRPANGKKVRSKTAKGGRKT